MWEKEELGTPETYCDSCGMNIQSTDLYCRICGAPINSTTALKERPQNARLEHGETTHAGKEVIPLPGSPLSIRTACLVAANLMFLTVSLVLFTLLFLVSRPDGSPAIGYEIVGTSTPYPTHAPYRTALPYKTATAYPTFVPYPTTGVLATATPELLPHQYRPIVPIYIVSRGCQLIVANQNTNLDSVVVLTNVDTNAIVAAVYVRASDSFSRWGISTGEYFIYVTLGLDWDFITGRFTNYPLYFRFEESVSLDTCPTSLVGSYLGPSYDYIEITLNAAEGEGSDFILVQPETFPISSP